MAASLVLFAVITVALLIVFWFAISALVQLKKTLVRAEKALGNVDVLVVNLNERLDPLLYDLHGVVQQADRELSRVDEVVSTIRDIGDKVNAVTRVVNEVISSPLIKVASLSAGAREALRKIVGR
ncbi:MAG TPA: hypothetical protein VGK02_01905 [Candidatus Aquicultor sp.]|jgi:uncharacterized protein YoxC